MGEHHVARARFAAVGHPTKLYELCPVVKRIFKVLTAPSDGFSEYYYLHEYFESLDFPRINDSEYAECGIIGLNSECSKERTYLALLDPEASTGRNT